MWGINLSVPLNIEALVSRYLTNKLMLRMPIINRKTFNLIRCLIKYYGVLESVSQNYPPVNGRLHTRYAPVRRSPPSTLLLHVLPLDLHVLSLPLAFILSQDQTLQCKNCLNIVRVLTAYRFSKEKDLNKYYTRYPCGYLLSINPILQRTSLYLLRIPPTTGSPATSKSL